MLCLTVQKFPSLPYHDFNFYYQNFQNNKKGERMSLTPIYTSSK